MGNKGECELCGNETYTLLRREVEGVIMEVCPDCQDMGDVPKVDRRRQAQANARSQRSEKFRSMVSTSNSPTVQSRMPDSPYKVKKKAIRKDRFTQYKVVDDATNILLKYRTTNQLSSKDFANSVFIKENYYKRIEKGTTAISLDLARKFEKKYKLKLVEVEDADEKDDYSEFLKQNKTASESMVYFKKRGQKPEYD